MIHGAVTAGLGAANLLGHLTKEVTMSTEKTAHELSPEHAGFRAEHESMKAGILGLTVTVALTTGLMAYFVKKNSEEHKKIQAQLDELWDAWGEHEVSRRRRHLPAETADQLVELPAYSRSRPTLPGGAFGALATGRYTVRGSGSFPSDMLRYDDATFASPEDEAKASASREERDINLILTHRPHYRKSRKPTTGRWESFGWEVT